MCCSGFNRPRPIRCYLAARGFDCRPGSRRRRLDSLVKRYSADTKTAEKGGDLSWFAPEELPNEFKVPLAGLKAGEVAEPVRTQFGVHVLRVTDRSSRGRSHWRMTDRIQRMALAKNRTKFSAAGFRSCGKRRTSKSRPDLYKRLVILKIRRAGVLEILLAEWTFGSGCFFDLLPA